MSIHSHIQIPKSVLLHFRDETDPEKKVWFLDITSGEIKRKPAKKLGTARGYYSNAVEQFWSQNIETPMGSLNKKVRAFCDGDTKEMTITADDMRLAKRYIKAAAVRSTLSYNALMEHSLTARFFSEQQNHDVLSLLGMNAVGPFDQLLDDLSVTILVNRSNRSFVVPQNCYYCVSRKNVAVFVVPISPQCAYVLMPREHIDNEDGNYAVVSESPQIDRMNFHALKYEYMFSGSFVAASCRSELEKLQHLRQKHLVELAALKQ